MTKQDDGLFLLEVLIDKIVFVKSPCFSDKDFRTCVNIECPAVEPLEICDDDPGACVAKSGGPFVKTFNNGKSCLFSLKEADISKAMSKFPIKICVYKSLPCGCLPTKIVMGEATIDMTKEFVQARKKFLEDPNSVSHQALKDSFRIVAPDGSETGEIVMFLRISCFGKLIITRFQGAGGPANLGATGGGSAIVDRSCDPKKDFQTNQDPCACGAARASGGSGGAGGPAQPCTVGGGGGFGVCPTTVDPYNSMPCEDPDDPCYCSGPKGPSKQQMVCRNTDQYCLHVPKDCCPTGNKVIFKIPTDSCSLGHKQRAHFNFTSDGVGDVARDEPGHLVPTTADDYPGVVYDFPKQVIKLRIGKTIEMPGRKSKLEYQFITPVVTHEKVVPIQDTRTAQCLPTCPGCCSSKPTRRALLSLPFYQELTEDQKLNIKTTSKETEHLLLTEHYMNVSSYGPTGQLSQASTVVNENSQSFTDEEPYESCNDNFAKVNQLSAISLYAFRSKRRSVSFSNTVDCISRSLKERSCYSIKDSDSDSMHKSLFGKKETVYMTLFNEFCRQRHSGTQATASINKCLQVSCDSPMDTQYTPSSVGSKSHYCSSCTVSSLPFRENKNRINYENTRYSDVYFFGRKKEGQNSCPAGMGCSESKTKLQRSGQITAAPCKSEKGKSGTNSKSSASVQARSQSSTTAAQTRKTKGSSAATATGKAVSIKDDKEEKTCPAAGGTKGDMSATVSHIRIGPREPCPVHGKEPCQGPKCIIASSGEDKAPVKVTTVTNPRRGVFELVIRRMTGAPLAKNELMLEWTPPPSRPPPCGSPCSAPCSPPGPCRPPKCKMIVCRPSPCKPKCCKKGCKKPCGPMPCRTVPCKKCCKSSCCGKPCRPCKPCPLPPRCKPCPPSPCAPPCCKAPCKSPCKSSPCLRPCPVGRGKTRRARSQPRIRTHKKRISPCCNRSKACPVVRCRSVPGPCIGCCSTPCPPRKCCSFSPCKPVKCCKSSCSSCC